MMKGTPYIYQAGLDGEYSSFPIELGAINMYHSQHLLKFSVESIMESSKCKGEQCVERSWTARQSRDLQQGHLS